MKSEVWPVIAAGVLSSGAPAPRNEGRNLLPCAAETARSDRTLFVYFVCFVVSSFTILGKTQER